MKRRIVSACEEVGLQIMQAQMASVQEHDSRFIVVTGAILDRLTHRVHILEANGESYRLRDAKRRQKRKPPEN